MFEDFAENVTLALLCVYTGLQPFSGYPESRIKAIAAEAERERLGPAAILPYMKHYSGK